MCLQLQHLSLRTQAHTNSVLQRSAAYAATLLCQSLSTWHASCRTCGTQKHPLNSPSNWPPVVGWQHWSIPRLWPGSCALHQACPLHSSGTGPRTAGASRARLFGPQPFPAPAGVSFVAAFMAEQHCRARLGAAPNPHAPPHLTDLLLTLQQVVPQLVALQGPSCMPEMHTSIIHQVRVPVHHNKKSNVIAPRPPWEQRLNFQGPDVVTSRRLGVFVLRQQHMAPVIAASCCGRLIDY